MTAVQLLLALQHGDSLFPNGSFAFSQGLEGRIALAGRPDASAVECFIRTQVQLRWAGADRVALAHAFRAGGNLDRVAEVDAEIETATLVEGLRTGSRRNGAALLTAHDRLGTPGARDYGAWVRAGRAHGHLCAIQGLVWRALGLAENAAVALSGYGFAAGIANAAVRLGLVGAIEAQRILASLSADIAQVADAYVPFDAEMEGYTPFADIAVIRHQRQTSRLFSN
jgi:urease accessory protein